MINFKSEYSYLKSINRIDDIIKISLENNLTHIGLCDYNTTYAAFEFYGKCIENKIVPIIGCSFYHNKQEFLVYAKNQSGFKQINYWLSNGFSLESNFDNVVVVLGKGLIIDKIINSEIVDNVLNIKHLFYGVFSHSNSKNSFLVNDYVQKNKLKSIFIDQCNYTSIEKFDAYITMRCICDNLSISKINKQKYKDHCFKKLNFNEDFLNLFDLHLDNLKANIIEYPYCIKDYSPNKYLSILANNGLKLRLKGQFNQNYSVRLNYELDIIEKLNFSSYFLIVWDICKYCHQNDILVGPGRGSASGCLVAYCLAITQIDPVENELLFERFLNPERTSMPDIDLDFEDQKRDDVVNYIEKRYSNVAKISTISRFLAKSAFRDVSKVYNLDKGLFDTISKHIDSSMNFYQNLKTNKVIQNEYQKNQTFRLICDIAIELSDLARQTSIHAAGVIVSNKDLNEFSSVENGVIMMSAKQLENLGLIKIDILAISNLTFVKRVLNKINISNIYDLPQNDEKTFKMLSNSDTLGIFQLESSGIKNVLNKVKPSSIGQLADVLALYRPGPMKFIDSYVRNDQINYDSILKKTNGVMIYQEQIMLLAQKISSFSLVKADILRVAMSKKDEKLLLSLKNDFINNANLNKLNNQSPEQLFDNILSFAGYGFNKSHAYSYARLSYIMAYLKVNYPDVYFSELFKVNFYSDKQSIFLSELESLNLKLLRPHYYYSDVEIKCLSSNKIILGFDCITGFDKKTCNEIIKNRLDIKKNDELIVVVTKMFNNLTLSDLQINNFIDAGCFDSFKLNNSTLKYNINSWINKKVLNSYITMPGEKIMILNRDAESYEVLSINELRALRYNFKYSIIKNKLSEFRISYNNTQITTIEKAHSQYVHYKKQYKNYLVVFKINTIKEILTKNNTKMSFLNVTSEGLNEIIVFPNTYNIYNEKTLKNINQYCCAEVTFEKDKIYLQKL